MREIGDWTGRTVLDLGCGTGFHLPLWAESATRVVGVEPHPPLVALARRRTRRLPTVTVLEGAAEALPLPDASVDVVHARWAYFFGPGSKPGLRELDRVVRRGGTAFVIDNDPTRSTFGGWFRRGFPEVDPVAVERFWSLHGWQRGRLDMGWSFASREDLEDLAG
jgi:ubiquinone/menaquinone biosynthesis C-methylase UbiE